MKEFQRKKASATLALSLLITSSFAVLALAVPATAAQTFLTSTVTLDSASSCAALGGTPNPGNSFICDISAPLVIPANVTVTIAPGWGLDSSGPVENAGTIVITAPTPTSFGTGGELQSYYGSFDNTGTILNLYGLSNYQGTFDNYGLVFSSSSAIVYNRGTFTDYCSGSVLGGTIQYNPVTRSCFDTVTSAISSLSSSLSSGFSAIESELSSGVSTIEGDIASLSTTVTSGFSTVESDLGGISSQLTSLQSAVSSLGKPPQVVTGSGESTLTPTSATSTVFTGSSNQLGTVTLTLNTTGVGHQDSVTVRYYTDPGTPGLYLQQTIASKGDTPLFTTSVAAWKVVIVASFGSTTGSISVNWAYSAVEPPS